MITLNSKVMRSERVAGRVIAGEALVMTAHDSMLHTLNEVGTVVWNSLEKRKTVRGIIEEIVEQYNVSRATAESDVIRFLGLLEKRKMIVILRNQLKKG